MASVSGRTLEVVASEVDLSPARVYNFEVAGDHTYAVGELQAWVHNAKYKPSRARRAWEKENKQPWPTDINGTPLIVHHIKPRCDFPELTYDPDNIKPMFPFGHNLLHHLQGDPKKYGGRRKK